MTSEWYNYSSTNDLFDGLSVLGIVFAVLFAALVGAVVFLAIRAAWYAFWKAWRKSLTSLGLGMLALCVNAGIQAFAASTTVLYGVPGVGPGERVSQIVGYFSACMNLGFGAGVLAVVAALFSIIQLRRWEPPDQQ